MTSFLFFFLSFSLISSELFVVSQCTFYLFRAYLPCQDVNSSRRESFADADLGPDVAPETTTVHFVGILEWLANDLMNLPFFLFLLSINLVSSTSAVCLDFS